MGSNKEYFLNITESNQHILTNFIEKELGEGANAFRYFKNRPYSIIKNHLVTLVLINNDQEVAYGHLDFENDIVWLGIAVSEKHYGKKYGNKMITELINRAKSEKIRSIELTVDIQNTKAINLYKKNNFRIKNKTSKYFQFELRIS